MGKNSKKAQIFLSILNEYEAKKKAILEEYLQNLKKIKREGLQKIEEAMNQVPDLEALLK